MTLKVDILSLVLLWRFFELCLWIHVSRQDGNDYVFVLMLYLLFMLCLQPPKKKNLGSLFKDHDKLSDDVMPVLSKANRWAMKSRYISVQQDWISRRTLSCGGNYIVRAILSSKDWHASICMSVQPAQHRRGYSA